MTWEDLQRAIDLRMRQEVAKPSRYYGNGSTIHHSGHVTVEVDEHGRVVSVWFRCQALPFRQHRVDYARADDMHSFYSGFKAVLTGVEILDEPQLDQEPPSPP